MTTELLELKIIKGIEPSPYTLGATATDYESVPEIIDLLAPSSTFRLIMESGVPGYQYQIAALKNGGIPADSAVADGSGLIATPVGNVTETLTLVCQPGDTGGMAGALKKFDAFIRAIHDFQSTSWQISPVYVKRRFSGDAAPVYALLIDMNAALDPDTGLGDVRRLTLDWTREPYWRAIAPGANPKLYAFQRRGLQPNVDYDFDDLDLNSFGGTASLQNYVEADVANADTFSSVSVTYNNFIDIDGDDIPGDAPALTCFSVNVTGTSPTGEDLTIARNTKPDVESTSPTAASMNHNGGDATFGAVGGVTLTYTVSASGIRCDPPTAATENNYLATIAYAAGAITGGDILLWERVALKNFGRYAVFMRGRVSSGLTTNMQLSLHLFMGNAITDGTAGLIEIDQIPAFNPTAPATWALQYIGNFDLTTIGKQVAIDGTGLRQLSRYSLVLRSVARGAAAAVSYQLMDIILLPYDESAARIDFPASTLNGVALDTTGYFRHGEAGDAGYGWIVNTAVPYNDSLITFGQIPLLEPGKANRLYFLVGDAAAASVGLTGNYTRVRLNIVPRWRHLRDVL